MKARIADQIALEAITPTALRAYVVFEGWRRIAQFGEVSAIYQKTLDGREHELIVPETEQIGDYADAVLRALNYIAQVEQRDQLMVYRDLTQSGRDVIRIRAPEAEDDGSIEVDLGVSLVAHSRDLLAAAACAAFEPRRAYHVGKIEVANDYMRRVSLGQTERGSYVVTLLAPVPPSLASIDQVALWPNMEAEPFDRQVTRTFVGALDAVRAAVVASNRGHGIEAFDSAVASGVSANFCEAIAQIIDRGEGAEVSVTWARTRPAPQSRTRVQFSRQEAAVIQEAARYYRSKEPVHDFAVMGFITKLMRDEGEFDGRVTIKAFVDGRPRSLHVEFAQSDYVRALEAHSKNTPVTLRGDLSMRGQRWHLINPSQLELLDQET